MVVLLFYYCYLCHHLYYVLPASSRWAETSLVSSISGFINLNWLFSFITVNQTRTVLGLGKVFKSWTEWKPWCSASLMSFYLIVWVSLFSAETRGKRSINVKWLQLRTSDLKGQNCKKAADRTKTIQSKNSVLAIENGCFSAHPVLVIATLSLLTCM